MKHKRFLDSAWFVNAPEHGPSLRKVKAAIRRMLRKGRASGAGVWRRLKP